MLERIVDMAAAELGIDPVELRKQNFLPPGGVPAHDRHRRQLRRRRVREGARRGVPHRRVRAAPTRASANGASAATSKQLGIGVSAYVEVTAGGQFQEFGAVEVHNDGTVTATVGTVAARPGPRDVVQDDRRRAARRADGRRARSCSPTPRSSRAAVARWGRARCRSAAARSTRRASSCVDKAKRLAAHLLEADVDDIVLHDGGGVGVAGVPATALSWARARAGRRRSGSTPRRLRGWPPSRARLQPGRGDAIPFGAHIAVVEVDTETGTGRAPAPRRGRRLRPHPQPDARRRAAARRHRAGRRAGAVRGRRVRRRRQPADRQPHGLRDAERGGAPELRGVEHRDADAAQPARCEGHRRSRARSARRRRCRTRSSTRCRSSGSATSTCRSRPSACGGRSATPRATG